MKEYNHMIKKKKRESEENTNIIEKNYFRKNKNQKKEKN
jgi:hypothetical protein